MAVSSLMRWSATGFRTEGCSFVKEPLHVSSQLFCAAARHPGLLMTSKTNSTQQTPVPDRILRQRLRTSDRVLVSVGCCGFVRSSITPNAGGHAVACALGLYEVACSIHLPTWLAHIRLQCLERLQLPVALSCGTNVHELTLTASRCADAVLRQCGPGPDRADHSAVTAATGRRHATADTTVAARPTARKSTWRLHRRLRCTDVVFGINTTEKDSNFDDKIRPCGQLRASKRCGSCCTAYSWHWCSQYVCTGGLSAGERACPLDTEEETQKRAGAANKLAERVRRSWSRWARQIWWRFPSARAP